VTTCALEDDEVDGAAALARDEEAADVGFEFTSSVSEANAAKRN
jgi:hypothetical protein